jgi:hypothetical protein
MSLPPMEQAIADEVSVGGYHPRISGHSDSQSKIIIRDLLTNCPLMQKRAASGELVVKLRHHQQVGHDDWVIDIALGTCSGQPQPPSGGEPIRFTAPAVIQVAIELKSIWTEHLKARKNRLRDFNSFHLHAHQYTPRTVAAAFLVINAAGYFLSPLNIGNSRREEISKHFTKSTSAYSLVKKTIDIFRSIHLRNSSTDVEGLEALGIVVVEHDNILKHPDPLKYKHLRKPSQPAPAPPAPKVGDPLHYQTMTQRICTNYADRYP